MSSRILVPFDNNPVAVSVKTASYTIPAGRFARLIVNLEGTATFTINAALAMRGVQNNQLASSALTRSAGAVGQQLQVDDGTLLAVSGNAFNSEVRQSIITQELWVPSGTVISGTGTFRIIVMEYNVIS